MAKSGDKRSKKHTVGHSTAAIVIEEGLCRPCHETQLAGSADICLMVAACCCGQAWVWTPQYISPHSTVYSHQPSPCQIQLASLCHENRSYLRHHPSSALLLALATRGTGDKYQTVENLDLLIIGVNIKSSFFLMFSPSLPGELQLTYHTSIYIIRLMKLLIIINLEELTIIPFLVQMK